jgi:hypothetical protein
MTGSAKQSSFGAARRKLDCFVAIAPRNDDTWLFEIRIRGQRRPSRRAHHVAQIKIVGTPSLSSGAHSRDPLAVPPLTLTPASRYLEV